ncbi:MAG: MEDS domain-containing protein [Mycobacterium sp.]
MVRTHPRHPPTGTTTDVYLGRIYSREVVSIRRTQGVVASTAGLSPFGHLGWGYRGRAEFLARAAEYIADGLDQHQWVEYVGEGSREQLHAELAAMPGITDRSDAGDIKVTPALEFYAAPADSEVVDPDVAVATRVAAVEKAITDGYTGFRAVCDATAVTRTPAQRDAFACFEFLIDQQMAVLPASALCAYDLDQLGEHAAGLICLHPFVGHGAPSFRLYAQPGTGFALSGDLNAGTNELFTVTLQRTWPLTTLDEPLVIDAEELEFITHHQLLALDHRARSDGRQVVLRTRQRLAALRVAFLEAHARARPVGGRIARWGHSRPDLRGCPRGACSCPAHACGRERTTSPHCRGP